MYLASSVQTGKSNKQRYNNYYIKNIVLYLHIKCMCKIPEFHRGAGDKKKKSTYILPHGYTNKKEILTDREQKYSTQCKWLKAKIWGPHFLVLCTTP